MPPSPAVVRAAGLALGVVADAVLGDPARGHPVAGFGRLATWLERRLYADAVAPGAALVVLALTGPVVGGLAVERLDRRRPVARRAGHGGRHVGGTRRDQPRA